MLSILPVWDGLLLAFFTFILNCIQKFLRVDVNLITGWKLGWNVLL